MFFMDEQLPKSNDVLRQARKEKKLTQHQLAEALSVGLDTVRSWERGRRSSPQPEHLEKLCTFFQKTPLELGFGATEDTATSSSVQATVPHADVNRRRMIKRVRSAWVDGVLQESLHKAAFIALGLQKQPDALENPWRLAVQETNLPPKPLPPGTSIVEIYDEADGDLLILGEAGAGKTTLLLELARTLLRRADQNDRKPVPVVFNLSSWAVKQAPLAEWLIEELGIKYLVPRTVAQGWIQDDQLIILLDGLDEVAQTARRACVSAMNVYKSQHPIVPAVVCCRQVEYFAVETRVKLQLAVLVQPLTIEQTHRYLNSLGKQIDSIKKALEEDSDLQEMARSPLMLSILTLAYLGETKASETVVLTGSFEKRRQLVLDRYAQRMLARGAEASYTETDTQRWLTWLARQMQQRSLTEFFVERMQPDWIAPGSPSDRYRTVALRFINGIEVIVLAALFALMRGGKVGDAFGVGAGLLGKLGAGKGNIIFGWMSPGIGGGVEAGGSLGVIFALIFSLQILLMSTSAFPVISWKSLWHGLKRGLKNGLLTLAIVTVFCVPIFTILGGLKHGLEYGGGMGLLAGLLVGLLSGLLAGLRYEPGVRSQRAQGRSFGARLGDGLILGLLAGLSFALVDLALHIVLESVVVYGLIAGFFFFCVFGFAGGSRLIPLETIQPAESVSWSWGNIRRIFPETLIRGLIGSLLIMFCVAVVIALGSGVFYGFKYGIRYGLIYGLIVGLVVGLTGVLASLLHSGWSSELLNENQIFQPNEGIRRSLVHALFAGILFAPIGGVLSGITCAVAFGVIGGLSGWLILGIGFALVFGLLIGFQFAMIHGGTACIEHYLLRWQLWRSGAIPANYIAFLDYAASRILLRKVGGGYIFAHRILLDYFASLPLPGEDI
jgi:transcriptional regulator with XRE-family HTH domain